MLFMRYVLLGRLADGTRVFWDTREGKAVKRPIARRLEPGESLRNTVVVMCLAPLLLLVLRLLGWLVSLLPIVDDIRAWLWIQGLMPVFSLDKRTGSIIAALCGLALAYFLYWVFCWLVFGIHREEYVPASMWEVAFATSRLAGFTRYEMGHSVLYPFFAFSLWGIPWYMCTISIVDNQPWFNHYDSPWAWGWFWFFISAYIFSLLILFVPYIECKVRRRFGAEF
ncbi:hypothetical protein JS530_03075 [Bifidobacterium sp. LC6]|uniref:Uncharacterized protein n=1 Tax=Bifidobacterium colobi TaxID=2809026 RepID=A0ABS5UUK7_9BIFI|nr:hypothetical protein [Bifidobacterium colobi]MBT1174500.1 hypothetical protein [Bifidobacterium colobi]